MPKIREKIKMKHAKKSKVSRPQIVIRSNQGHQWIRIDESSRLGYCKKCDCTAVSIEAKSLCPQ